MGKGGKPEEPDDYCASDLNHLDCACPLDPRCPLIRGGNSSQGACNACRAQGHR